MKIPFEEFRLKPLRKVLANQLIKIIGPDAQAYLNSQTTNNVNQLSSNAFQFNSILDLSGKIISSFILLKKSNHEFYLVVANEFLLPTIERIEKYHIAEEFEVSTINQVTTLNSNQSNINGFRGQYFFEDDVISFDNQIEEFGEFELAKILCGIPELGKEVFVSELINNTRFDELGVDYKKGCYPGQETVSKIETRRGAAFKAVLIICDELITTNEVKITIASKKIGEIRNRIIYEEKTYLYALVNRENRIDNYKLSFELGTDVFSGQIHYYPYVSPKKRVLAIDLYDHAVSLFQAGDNQNAVGYFQLAIKVDPKFEDAYESLGVLYGRLEEFDKAISLMEQLKELNPKCMMALTNLSLFNMKQGNIETAEKYKADATLLNFELLGDEAQKKKQKEEYEQKRLAEISRREGMFKQVLDMDPDDAMANNGMGEIELDRKNYELASKHFRKAIEVDEKYSVAYLGLAKCLYQMNDSENMQMILEQGIRIASKNGDLMPANEMQSMLLGSR